MESQPIDIGRVLVRQLSLRKSLESYRDYLNIWSAIVVRQDPRPVTLAYIVLALLAFTCAKYLYLAVLDHDIVERILLADVLYPTIRKEGLNYMMALCVGMTAGLYYHFYLHGEFHNLQEIHRILFLQETSYFIVYQHRGESIYVYLRRYALRLLYLFQTLVVICYCFLPFTCIYAVILILKHRTQLFPSVGLGALHLVWGALNGLLGILTIVVFVHIVSPVVAMCCLITKITIIGLGQLQDTISRPVAYRLTDIHLFHRRFVHFLFYVIKGNGSYGNAFLVFMTCMCPFNLWLVMGILFGHLTEAAGLYAVFMAMAQLTGIFGLHYTLTLYTAAVHRPGRCLNRIMLANLRVVQAKNIRAKIRLMHCIELINTNNRYGLTYGPFGLVTMRTFAKFVMLYCKFLLITYKLHLSLDSR